MKIVIFSDSYWPRVNGITVSVDTFSHALIRRGHEVLIVCLMYPQVEQDASSVMEKPGDASEPVIIRVPSYPMPVSREDRLAKFHKWFWMSRQIELFAPDIVHINSDFVIAQFGFQYGRQHKIPIVYTFHTLWGEYASNYLPWAPDWILRRLVDSLMRRILRQADSIIVPSEEIRELVKQYRVKKQVTLLPTGVDPCLFNPHKDEAEAYRKSLDDKYPALRGKRVLLFAGRVAKEKNLGFLLRLMPLLAETHPEAVLFIAGNGPDLDFYKEEAEALKIGGQVVFAGYMERSELALIYAAADIFVFPSKTETQGLVTIEAMLSGTPVVAIGERGTITVMGGDNGGFMTPDDPAVFLSRVCELLDDGGLYRKKCAEALAHGQAWTIEAQTARLEALYQDVLRKH
jgi:glycosyltransferase involved in cell wall biosynthesis